MASITITIPDASLNRIVDGVCGAFDYDRYAQETPNPVTKAVYAKQQLITFVKTAVKNYEIRTANQTNENTVASEISAINLT